MKEINCGDWNEFREHVTDNYSQYYGFIFRGHRDSTWSLKSTLTRLLENISQDIDDYLAQEQQLKNFRIAIRGLTPRDPKELSNEDLWTLGQHYGLATPLLDWTTSPYIACYFAFEGQTTPQEGKRTIWALNKAKLLREIGEEHLELKIIETLSNGNARIVSQAGLFTLFPTGVDLQDWLTAHKLDHHLTKINIENEYRIEALNDLRLMNITGSSIYPDLHGASTACNLRLQNVSENWEQRKTMHKLLSELNSEEK